MKTVLITIATLFLFLGTTAQSNTATTNCELQPISIGDKIPEMIWDKSYPIINHNRTKAFMKLSEYGNKLIILDFWATYCHPCVESLDFLDSIQAEFKEELVVVPVLVHDKIEKAAPFMIKKGYPWPCVVGDTVMSYTMVRDCHVGFGTIWIKDGKLLAVPSKKSLTVDNIRKIIQNKPVTFIPIKKRK